MNERAVFFKMCENSGALSSRSFQSVRLAAVMSAFGNVAFCNVAVCDDLVAARS
jgi:hypothetical protein